MEPPCLMASFRSASVERASEIASKAAEEGKASKDSGVRMLQLQELQLHVLTVLETHGCGVW